MPSRRGTRAANLAEKIAGTGRLLRTRCHDSDAVALEGPSAGQEMEVYG